MKSIRLYDNPADAGYAESVLSGAGIAALVVDGFGGLHCAFHLQVAEADADRALGLLGNDDCGQPVPDHEAAAAAEAELPAPILEVPFYAVCRGCNTRWQLTAAESGQRQFTCQQCGQGFYILNIDIIPGVWKEGLPFPQPRWKRIGDFIQQFYPAEAQPDIWTQAALHWVRHIRAATGGDYGIYQSKNFIILTARDKAAAKNTLELCESSLATVRTLLGAVAWRWTDGKHVTLFFEDESTYYRYYSCFARDETEVARSGGVFFKRGYCHTVIPRIENYLARGAHSTAVSISWVLARTLAHEYTHLSLAPYKLPLWLNEGLAVNAENAATERAMIRWDENRADIKAQIWNENTIQEFWSGDSFQMPAKNSASYNLAQILVANMLKDFGAKMPDFIRDAACEDAGEASAQMHLGIGLGEVAGEFLGPGNWKPNPSQA